MSRMIRHMLLLAAIALFIGCASEPQQQPAGRYQLSPDGTVLYVTDTRTGEVWYRKTNAGAGERWQPLGSPTTRP